jgi:hypothetical protein
MLRRDYILRMVQEAAALLSRIRSLKKDERWSEAGVDVNAKLETLVDANVQTVVNLSTTELLARVIRDESTLAVKEKTVFVSALLKEAGDIATAQNRDEEGRGCYLKGLDLLLDVLREGDTYEFPEFMPRVEMFVCALAETALPLSTQAALMQHYERTGQFAKAEDCLFSILGAQPDNTELLDFGIGFLKRLESQADRDLTLGNLPREEVQSSLAELQERRRTVAGIGRSLTG